MKIRPVAILAFVVASGSDVSAQEVINPCNICPNGATAGEDTAPYIDDGDPITCKEIIENAKLFETGTDWCAAYEFDELSCCPPAAMPKDPCTICPDGITTADDIGTSYGCSDLVQMYSFLGAESDACKKWGEFDEGLCCPNAAAENPCIICPDGASAGDDFVPYADQGFPMTCKEIIEFYATFEAGSEMCVGANDVAKCCPAPSAPENPCNICPGGATAGDYFTPYSAINTCGEMMAEAKLFETNSKDCKWYEGYEVSCCPKAASGGVTLSGFGVGWFAFVVIASSLWDVWFV